ncbi:MAG: 16S rRNA (cytidine(1402)-2'-O)-methyltransferase [Alphaproteobacteria bacterium]|nr:16S rRNA (cytidine(1402)-2'-O)-methyltransferase [Alphaproteobacteria bacterium]
MGILYIVATPIGNLSDITFRAVDILKKVSAIYCENPRVTKKLTTHYSMSAKLYTYNAHSSSRVLNYAIKLLESGEDVALVSDAGTPTISDPGVRFVRGIRAELPDVSIIAIPGPSALVSALSISGAPASEFIFYGFLPQKKGRSALIKEIAEQSRTSVLYEGPHRLLKTLEAFSECLDPLREVAVARELTKIHEECIVGNIAYVLSYYTANPDRVRGECVIIISSLYTRV